MTFVSPALLREAVNRLEGTHPLAVVTVPALLREGARQGVDVTATPVRFGSTQESALLNDYFTLPRPPEKARPYRAIWAKSSSRGWQTRKYPGGSLQRMRTDQAGKGRVLTQTQGPDGDRWGLNTRSGEEIAVLSSEDATAQIALVDLAIWMGRDVDVSALPPNTVAHLGPNAGDIDRLLAWFIAEFEPRRGDLIDTLYTEEIPSEYRQIPFADQPLLESTYEALGSLPPAPNYQGSTDDLVAVVEQHVQSQGFSLSDGLVNRVISAWLNGDIVLLVGQPGTGKSAFARHLATAFETHLGAEHPVTVSVRADFDEAEFIGYERLDGTAQLREFSTQVLQAEEPLGVHLVILEEFNLAAIENYLASVLVATQDEDRRVRLPSGESVQLPVDAFIIGTCNSYLDEPDTRMRVSSPTKRRSTVITMPNVLADRFETGGEEAVIAFATELVKNETKQIQSRIDENRASQFDHLRVNATSRINSPSDFSPEVARALGDIARSILETPVGASWFTAGLLRDIAITVARSKADPAAEMIALGDAIASKIVHQLRGTHSDIQDFNSAVAILPNAEEIGHLVNRMMDGPSEELIPLL